MVAEPTIMSTRPILRVLSHNWWLLLLRGIFAIVFGILAFVWPGMTLLALVVLFGVYALLDGFAALYAALQGRNQATPVWWLILIGLVSIAAGLITFFYPQKTALVLIIFIGAWALVHGLLEIIGAMYLRKEIDNEWLLILSGLISVLFGLAVLISPGAGALAMVWLIGGYAILFGLVMVWLAFRMRRLGHKAH